MPSRPTRVQGKEPMPEEVLTVEAVAAPPRLAEKTVYAMADAAELPAFKLGGQ